MNPLTAQMGLLILEAALKWTPTIALEIAKLFSKTEHSLADWVAIFDGIKSYQEMDAESQARVGITTISSS